MKTVPGMVATEGSAVKMPVKLAPFASCAVMKVTVSPTCELPVLSVKVGLAKHDAPPVNDAVPVTCPIDVDVWSVFSAVVTEKVIPLDVLVQVPAMDGSCWAVHVPDVLDVQPSV